MLGSIRLKALAVAALMAGLAQAQIAPVGPGPAGLTGFGGFAGGGVGVGRSPLPVGGISPASPYALATVAGNPYAAGTLGMSPYGVGGYGLSTTGTIGPWADPYQFNPPWGIRQDPMNGYLTGVASVTAATGQYWKDIGQARLTREEANRSVFETARKRVELERWYESQKMRTQDIVDASVRSDLERARRDPPMPEVVSGRSLNDLLNNVRKIGVGRLTRGPNISLEDDTLRQISLVAPGGSGSGLGLFKNMGNPKETSRFPWPLSLQEPVFNTERDRLTRNLDEAVAAIREGRDIPVRLNRDITADLRALQEKVDNSNEDLTISQQLQARAFMRQLGSAVTSLRGPNAQKFFNNTWNAKGRTVAELLDHMIREGLDFGPATPGNEAAYMALFYAVREFEGRLALTIK